MKQATSKNFLLLIGVGVLIFGAIESYVLGVEQGRWAVIAEQTAEREQTATEAEAALVEAANPFAAQNQAAVNPFEGAYQNPFESATINPFAQ